MEKKILKDYMDACELIKETECGIRRLRKKRQNTVQESVKGSTPDFPYTETHFRITGTTYTYSDDRRLRMEEKLLEERQAEAEKIKTDVESWMNTIPVRMQRIIRCRFFEGMSWEQTAERVGRKATGESLRKEFNRFMIKK